MVATWLLATAAGACATRSAPPPAVSPAPAAGPAEACALLPTSAHGPDTVRVALTEPVDPRHAPSPRNASEQLLFAQLYEPLVRMDCTGQPYPGLAASWRVDTTGRRWTFTLRDDARFWDGVPVTARDVVSSWQMRVRDSVRAPRLMALPADSVVVVDDRTVTVVFHAVHRELPAVLASPELAVTAGAADAADAMWPVGTGAYRVGDIARAGEPVAAAGAGGIIDSAIVVHAPSATGAPVLDFRLVPEPDARDALDAGAGLLVTSAPAVLGYAATRPDMVSVPLPWDRTYVLLSPARRARGVEPAADTAVELMDASFRAALARDAVRAEARAAEGPSWWEGAGICVGGEGESGVRREERPARPPGQAGTPAPTEVRTPLAPRIVYPRDDRVARDLADRLVALAAIAHGDDTRRATALASIIPSAGADPDGRENGATRLIATGLSPDAFTATLHAGRDAAYVVSLPRHVFAPCAHRSALTARVPWLTPDMIVPLVETRAHLIARRNVDDVFVDWDGTLRIGATFSSMHEPRP